MPMSLSIIMPFRKPHALNGEAVHMYFDYLLRGDYPFAQEDYDVEPFRTFISQMEEWKPMRKKFQLEWVVEGNLNVTQFRRYLRLYVTPEYNGERNKSVSYGRISRWGITTETKSFNLYLLFNDDDVDSIDEDAEHLTFYNTYDGYFTGRMSKNYYSFHDIPDGNIYKVSLCVKVSHIFKEIFSFDVNDYLQLFETGRYSILSDRKSDMPSYLLLPYDITIVKPAGEEYPKRYFQRMVLHTSLCQLQALSHSWKETVRILLSTTKSMTSALR